MLLVSALCLILISAECYIIYNQKRIVNKLWGNIFLLIGQIMIFSSIILNLQGIDRIILSLGDVTLCISAIVLFNRKEQKILKMEEQHIEQETLIVQSDENIDKIIARIKFLHAKNILIILLSNVPALQNAANFWSLHQFAQKENIKLTFAGVDKTVLSTAKLLGYKVDSDQRW